MGTEEGELILYPLPAHKGLHRQMHRDVNTEGFEGHPRPSRGVVLPQPLPKGHPSTSPKGDVNTQEEPLFTQREANEGGQQREFL